MLSTDTRTGRAWPAGHQYWPPPTAVPSLHSKVSAKDTPAFVSYTQFLFSCLCSKVSICNYVTCHMSNAYVDPWDMLNNFCFHVYAQKWVFVIMSHVTCHFRMSHVIYVKCLCWSLGHAELLLFSCVSSKVSICNYVTCHMSHVACHMSHVTCQMLMLILGPCWTIFVFMSMLKCRCLWVKMTMDIFWHHQHPRLWVNQS